MMNSLKKYFTALSVLAIVLAGLNTLQSPASGNVTGAPAGRTGSPGDINTCASSSCHTGPVPVTIPGLITSDIPASGYFPGQVYNITASISAPGHTRFGFEVSPQDPAGNKLGNLTATNPTTTITLTTGKYITHKSAGTTFGAGTASWSFTWTAPALGTGNVTFYGAFNVTNNNGLRTGDTIRLSTLTVQEDPTAGIASYPGEPAMQVYPNPCSDKLQFSSPVSGTITATIIDLAGRELLKKTLEAGEALNTAALPTGLYVMRIETNKGTIIRKIEKQ